MDLAAIGIFLVGFHYLSEKDLKERKLQQELAIKKYEIIWK
jgi:hypothetical protein